MMHGAWLIFVKDWKLFTRDKLALMLTFIVPVVVSAVIGFAIGGMTKGDIPPLQLAICDFDNTPETRKLTEDLSGLDILDADIIEPTEENLAKKREEVMKGYLPALILIEEGFAEGKEGSKIRFINDPGQAVQAKIIYNTLVGLSMNIKGKGVVLSKLESWFEKKGYPESTMVFARKYIEEGWSDIGSMFSVGEEDGSKKDSGNGKNGNGMMGISEEEAAELGIVNEEVAGLDIDNPGYSHAVAGMAVMFAFFTLTHAATTLLEERDTGTLKRLLISPLSISTILIGKTMNIIATGSIQLIFLFIAGMFLFKLNVMRDPIHLLLFIIATGLMASGVGLFLASLATTARSAGGLSTLFILILASMGGAMFPSMFMPTWMQTVGKFTPVYWAMKGFQGIFWFQKPLTEQLGLLLVVILWGIGFITLGILIFRKKLAAR